MYKGKTIGLALGGGAAKGWAHLGVLQVLAEKGIQPDLVAGTSMGAVVGAVWASDNLERFTQIALKMDWRSILGHLDVVFPRTGLIDGHRVIKTIRSHLVATKIEDLPRPFQATATDLETGLACYLDRGDIMEAIRASISIPGIFTPVRVAGQLLVDGGVADPVPVGAARRMGADYVIAVDVAAQPGTRWLTSGSRKRRTGHKSASKHDTESEDSLLGLLERAWETIKSPAASLIHSSAKEELPSIFDVITAAGNIMQAQITQANLAKEPPDVLIQPQLADIRLLEFHRAEEAIAKGREATIKALDLGII